MNKLVNVLTLGITIISGFYSTIFRFELEVFNLKWNLIPYVQETFTGVACFVGALGVLRMVIRRRNYSIFNYKDKFLKIYPLSKPALSYVTMYLIFEAIFMLIFGLFFLWVTPYTIVLGVVFLVLLFEQIVFAIQCQQPGFCRMGFTKKAIISVDREADVLYFNGLKRVDVDLGRMYFDYKEDIQLSLRKENIALSDRQDFDNQLRDCVSKKQIYFGEGYEAFIKET